jgi:hypothetical protein
MNSDVEIVRRCSSASALQVTRRSRSPALRAARKELKESCLRFAPVPRVRTRVWEALPHLLPVPPEAGFPEPGNGQPCAVEGSLYAVGRLTVFGRKGLFGKRGLVVGDRRKGKKEDRMSIWILVLIVVGWFVLQAYILPKFGIST